MLPPSLRFYLWGSATAISPHFPGKGLRQDPYQLVLVKKKKDATTLCHPILTCDKNQEQGEEDDGRKKMGEDGIV